MSAAKRFLPAGAALLVLASRLPFLGPGYGLDGDAWLTAEAAGKIAATGSYVMSRVPGHPLQEYAYAAIWNSGPLAFNLVSALMSVVAFGGLAAAARRFGLRDYLLAGLALAFVPAVYLASVTAMDYVWALAFLMLALYFVAADRPIAAGIIIGLAAASRVTSILFVAPYILMFPGPWRTAERVRAGVKMGVSAALVAGLSYLPVLLAYRSGLPEVFDDPVALFVVLKKATVDVWGMIGFAALLVVAAIAAAHWLIRRSERAGLESPEQAPRLVVAGWALAVLLVIYLFVRLPHEAGYLIPALPFAFLLLAQITPRRAFVALCAALMVAPFAFGLYTADRPNSPESSPLAFAPLAGQPLVVDPLLGPVPADHSARGATERFVELVFAASAKLPEPSVVAAGNWLPWLTLSRPADMPARIEYALWLTPEQVEERLRAGWNVYYLRESEAARVGSVSLPADLAERAPQPLLD